jgi:hypothetical protein
VVVCGCTSRHAAAVAAASTICCHRTQLCLSLTLTVTCLTQAVFLPLHSSLWEARLRLSGRRRSRSRARPSSMPPRHRWLGDSNTPTWSRALRTAVGTILCRTFTHVAARQAGQVWHCKVLGGSHHGAAQTARVQGCDLPAAAGRCQSARTRCGCAARPSCHAQCGCSSSSLRR